MKKNLLSLLMLFLCGFANAQFTAGQKLIGGQVSFNSTHTQDVLGNSQNNFAINLSPSFYRFASPAVLNGFGITYGYQHDHYHDNLSNPVTDQYDHKNTFGVFVNRTKLETLAKRFYFTYRMEGSLGYSFGKNTFPALTNNSSFNAYSAAISGGIGLLYQLNNRFLLTSALNNLVSFSYTRTDQKTSAGTSTATSGQDNISLSTGLSNLSLNSLSIGMMYMLK